MVVIVITGTLRLSQLIWDCELCKGNQMDHVEAKEESVSGVSN